MEEDAEIHGDVILRDPVPAGLARIILRMRLGKTGAQAEQRGAAGGHGIPEIKPVADTEDIAQLVIAVGIVLDFVAHVPRMAFPRPMLKIEAPDQLLGRLDALAAGLIVGAVELKRRLLR